MAILSGEAIVLGARPYSNTSLIVTLSEQRTTERCASWPRAFDRRSRELVWDSNPQVRVISNGADADGSDLGTMRNCETTRVYPKDLEGL